MAQNSHNDVYESHYYKTRVWIVKRGINLNDLKYLNGVYISADYHARSCSGY